ncbi:MAG: hypothetical protein U0992_04510 [Planctomycetaceae bacterium]
MWQTLIDSPVLPCTPCGLGCRDTLRLEAAMPLYGHELDESIDPLTAGLEFGVKLQAPGGALQLAQRAAVGVTQRRVGLHNLTAGGSRARATVQRWSSGRPGNVRYIFTDAGKTGCDGLRRTASVRRGDKACN